MVTDDNRTPLWLRMTTGLHYGYGTPLWMTIMVTTPSWLRMTTGLHGYGTYG